MRESEYKRGVSEKVSIRESVQKKSVASLTHFTIPFLFIN